MAKVTREVLMRAITVLKSRKPQSRADVERAVIEGLGHEPAVELLSTSLYSLLKLVTLGDLVRLMED